MDNIVKKIVDKRVILTIVFSSLFVSLLSIGYHFYDKGQRDDKKKREQQELLRRESIARDQYLKIKNELETKQDFSFFTDIVYSSELDIGFINRLGWETVSVDCSSEYKCNLNFKKDETKLFNYVELKKDLYSFKPIFNEESMEFHNVEYSFTELSADNSAQLSLKSCEDTLIELYRENDYLKKIGALEMDISNPSLLFSGVKYQWNELLDVKMGKIIFKTDNIFNLGYLEQLINSRKMSFDLYERKNNSHVIMSRYYCN
ncbi:MAG: hypothetical protein ACRCTB_08735 [Vibrio sp.]